MAPVGIFDAAIDLRKGVSIYLNFFGNRYLQFQVGHIFTVARAAARTQTRFPATNCTRPPDNLQAQSTQPALEFKPAAMA